MRVSGIPTAAAAVVVVMLLVTSLIMRAATRSHAEEKTKSTPTHVRQTAVVVGAQKSQIVGSLLIRLVVNQIPHRVYSHSAYQQ